MSLKALHAPTLTLSLAAAALALAGCTTTNATDKGSPMAAKAALILQADSALTRLYEAAPTSREMIARAPGYLVCPAVVGGSLGVGLEGGRCILRERGADAGYYRVSSLSLGLQAGAQSRAMIYVFNAREALHQFRESNGWTAGADASVSVASAGANLGGDTNTASQAVVGYVLTNTGLEAGVSMSGSKFTKVDM